MKVYEDRFGDTYPDMRWEPKAAFRTLEGGTATSELIAVSDGFEELQTSTSHPDARALQVELAAGGEPDAAFEGPAGVEAARAHHARVREELPPITRYLYDYQTTEREPVFETDATSSKAQTDHGFNEDRSADGRLEASLDRMEPLAGSPPPPQTFQKDDVVLVLDQEDEATGRLLPRIGWRWGRRGDHLDAGQRDGHGGAGAGPAVNPRAAAVALHAADDRLAQPAPVLGDGLGVEARAAIAHEHLRALLAGDGLRELPIIYGGSAKPGVFPRLSGVSGLFRYFAGS